MTDAQVLHDDQWGQILNHPSEARLEIRWYDTTVDLDGDGSTPSWTRSPTSCSRRSRRQCWSTRQRSGWTWR